MKFEFGSFELDLATCELRRSGRNVPLQPRVFATLRYLIEHRDRVVAKQELIEALWGGVQLNAVAVPWTINRARKALSDESGQGYIETLRGHGYRFVGKLRVLEDVAAVSGKDVAQPEPAPSFVERPFVGRAAVMLQLTAALDAAAAGQAGQGGQGSQGRLCLLTGEAGIGKTRCAEELALVARRRGLSVWVGRCFEHASAPAFWPFIQVVRAASSDGSLHESLRLEADALLRELEPQTKSSHLTSTSGPASARPDLSDDDRFWLLDRLCRWLCRCARAQVRVVELEDLHCADESSLQALSLLAPMLAQSRLLVVASARQNTHVNVHAEPHATGFQAKGLTSRLRPCEHIPLKGLHSEDVQSFLRAVLDDEIAVRLSQALYAKTAGNPLFLHEVTHVIAAQYARKLRVEIEDVQLPAAVTEVISDRLHQLAPATRLLLDAASVVGEEFGVAVLQRVAKLSEDEVLSGLQGAVKAGVVEAHSDRTTHQFVHPLMREVLYSALSSARRAQLHAEVGLALEAFGLIAPPLSELAFHFHHAPLEAYYARAKRYARLAGDAALAASAYDEAAQRYAWALEAQAHVVPQDVAAVCDLLLISAFALAMCGRGVEGRKHCERAIELAIEAELPEFLVTAAKLLRPSVWLAYIPDLLVRKALETALHMLPDSARAQRSRAYAQLASLPPYSLSVLASRKMSDEATRWARDSDDPLLEFEAQRSRLFGLCAADSIDEQLRVADDMLRSDQEHTWRWAADAYFASYHASLQRADASAADRALRAYERHARERRLRVHAWHCERLRAQRLLDAGRLDAAEQRFQELSLDAARLNIPLASMYHRPQRSALNFERTGCRLSQGACETREVPEPPAWAQRVPVYRVFRLLIDLELGERARARRELNEYAKEGFAALSDDPFGLYSLVQLVEVALELSEVEAATQLRALLEPYAGLIALSPFTISRGAVARYLGQLELWLDRPDAARRYFEQASELNARVGNELQRLYSQLGLAECLTRARTKAELEQGKKLALSVAQAADSLGARALASSALQVAQLPAGSGKRTAQSQVPPARGSSAARTLKAQRGRSQLKG